MRAEEPAELKQDRKDFEESIQYRQFVERYADGTYKLYWVESRWGGWKDHAEFIRAKS